MTRAELIASCAEKVLSGNSDTTAENVRALITQIVDSCVNLEQDADQPGGFPLIDEDGRILASLINAASQTGLFLKDNGTWSQPFPKVIRSGSDISMDHTYTGFSFQGSTPRTWELPEIRNNRIYHLDNRSSAILTLNYPGGSSLIWDMVSASLVNTLDIAAGTSVRIMDDGTNLTISTPF